MDTAVALREAPGASLALRTGNVMGDKIWSETHVSGSGGGVMIKGFGVGSSSTRSHVVNKREFWVRFDSGTEKSFTFNANVAKVREGQTLTFVMLESAKRESALAFYNHGTKETVKIAGAGAVIPGKTFLALGSIPATILGFVMASNGSMAGGLLLLGLCWLPIYFRQRKAISSAISHATIQVQAALPRMSG